MPQQRQAFQRELDVIDAKVTELFDLIVPDLARATRVFLSGSSEPAEVLAEHELVVDLLRRRIHQLIFRGRRQRDGGLIELLDRRDVRAALRPRIERWRLGLAAGQGDDRNAKRGQDRVPKEKRRTGTHVPSLSA